MKKIMRSWAASLQYLFSSFFWHLFGQVLWHALPVAITIIAFFCGLSLLGFCAIPYLSIAILQMLQVKAPLLAMILSPLYMPFLIRAAARVMGKVSCRWGKMIAWSLSMYGLMMLFLVAFYWLCIEGSLALLMGVCSGMLLLFFLFAPRIAAFPVASIAVIFEPMSNRSSREVWRHAQRMTWQELPGILVLMVSLTPFSYAFYYFSRALYYGGWLSLDAAHAVLHALSILCWHIGWLAFMVFYQQRKKAYIS